MGRQSSKRNRDKHRGNVRLDLYQQSVDLHYSAGWLYRLVEEESAEALQRTTRGIRGKDQTRIAGIFSMTYVYPNKLERARAMSRLAKPPTMEDLALELGRLPIESLHRTLEAEVIDVRPFPNAVGICITYPELHDENTALGNKANQLIRPVRPTRVTPGNAGHHVSVIKGAVSKGQLAQIRREAPASIAFSAIRTGGFTDQTF